MALLKNCFSDLQGDYLQALANLADKKCGRLCRNEEKLGVPVLLEKYKVAYEKQKAETMQAAKMLHVAVFASCMVFEDLPAFIDFCDEAAEKILRGNEVEEWFTTILNHRFGSDGADFKISSVVISDEYFYSPVAGKIIHFYKSYFDSFTSQKDGKTYNQLIDADYVNGDWYLKDSSKALSPTMRDLFALAEAKESALTKKSPLE